MKTRHVLISLAAVAFFAFLFSEDSLARAAWRKYRSPSVALALDRGGAALAIAIGSYSSGDSSSVRTPAATNARAGTSADRGA